MVIAESKRLFSRKVLNLMKIFGRIVSIILIFALITGCIKKIDSLVVENPQYNVVSNKISKNIIGKYSVEHDPQMYFEIFLDGTFELSLNSNSGYSQFTSETMELITYYSDSTTKRILLSFNIKSGQYSYPRSLLSASFESYGDNNVFTSLSYDSDYELKFEKQI